MSFRGLPDLVVAQVLFGLQQRCRDGALTQHTRLRALTSWLRAERVSSLDPLSAGQASGAGMDRLTRGPLTAMIAAVRRARMTSESEYASDVSYLPELRSYLDDLLRTRERLQAMAAADDWAKREAMPSEEEITRLRRLIRRVSGNLESLTPGEQAEIRGAVTALRSAAPARGRHRAQQGLAASRPPRRQRPLPAAGRPGPGTGAPPQRRPGPAGLAANRDRHAHRHRRPPGPHPRP